MIKVLVIGEQCDDVFIYGNCDRLSPEAPVPVMKIYETVYNKGMSGNLVSNLKAMDQSLEITHWHQQSNISKTRYIDRKHNHMFLRIDQGEEDINSIKIEEESIRVIEEMDIVIVSDYNKGYLSEEDIYKIGAHSKFSVIDTKRVIGYKILSTYDYIKLNEYEYKSNINNINNEWLEKIIVTLGCDGAKCGKDHYKSPNPKETIDVSGAGDTFTAAFSLRYYKTKSVAEAIVYANEMASIVVSKRGVSTP
jgi:D-beta-D-heptose 7-phosphate kinase/D-beta-D-heptose 1-phosphate adenosyltransferase